VRNGKRIENANSSGLAAVSRTDYAGNGGGGKLRGAYGPNGLSDVTRFFAEEDTMSSQDQNGITFQTSQIRFGQISDGTSNTYCVGEKYLMPGYYVDGNAPSDDQYITMGHDQDVIRYSFFPGVFDPNNAAAAYKEAAPRQDTPGAHFSHIWGSAHAATFNMVYCDGSVHGLSYSIDGETHRRLGSRNDGLPVGEGS
jgi:prepilin-type processing-associated H-X9-DG protein